MREGPLGYLQMRVSNAQAWSHATRRLLFAGGVFVELQLAVVAFHMCLDYCVELAVVLGDEA